MLNTDYRGTRVKFASKTTFWVLAALALTQSVHAQSTITVLIARGENVSSNTIHLDIIEELNNVMDKDFATAGINFELASPILVHTFCEANSDSDLDDEISCAKAQLSYLRDQTLADLVMLVVDKQADVTQSLPGAADSVPPLPIWNITTAHSDVAYSAVDIKWISTRPYIAVHEVGHNLYLQHDLSELDLFDAPRPDNHGYETPEAQQTLMHKNVATVGTWSRFSSPSWSILGSPAGNTATANATAVISEESGNVVSRYRQPPPPEPECEVVFFGCNETDDPMVFVSFDEPLGYTAIDFAVDKLLGNGTWSPIGGLSNPGCVSNAANLGLNTYRVLLNTIHGISSCQVVYIGDFEDCNANPEW